MNPTAVYELIRRAGRVQLSTLPELAAVRAAGLESAILELLDKTAANAANPIVDLSDDAAR